MAKLRCTLLALLTVITAVGFGQSYHLARLDLNQANDWSRVLAQFVQLEDPQKSKVLRGLMEFIKLGQQVHIGDEEPFDFLPQLALQRKSLSLLPPVISEGSRGIAQAKALGELASNAFDFALNQSSSQVRSVAIEVAENLMPSFYEPLVSGGHCGTGYDYMVGKFRGGFSESLRTFGAKNLAWVEKVDPREEVDDAKHLLRANLRLPSAKLAIVKGLESENEEAVDKALIRVMQWPDQEFIPHLQALIVAEDSRVRPFYWLTEAVMAYRERAVAVIEPVLGKIKYRNQWMNDLADHSCRESWEYCLRLAQSPESWSRALGVAFVKAMAQGFWMPHEGPKSLVPKDATTIANRIVLAGLADPEARVRAAAVSVHDWIGKTDWLLKFAKDRSAQVREEVANFLSDLPGGVREEYIWKLAGDSSLSVQRSVAWEICEDNDLGLEVTARKASKSASAHDRAASAIVLSKLGFESEVLPLLKDSDAHVRASALLSLGDYSNLSVEFILPMCADGDSVVVQLAVQGLMNRIDEHEEELNILAKALALAKPQNAHLIRRQIELLKRRIENDDEA